MRMVVGRTLVAIHQPNFFPWLGFFDKLRRADTFVLLDTVEFSKGSRTNRVEVLVGGEPHWITAPVQRAGIGGPIRDVLIDEERDWRCEDRQDAAAELRRPASSMPLSRSCVGCDAASDSPTYNEHAIRRLAETLGLATPIVRASDLDVDGRATELLIDIVRAVGGAPYLAGGGAGGYQEDERFAAAGIELDPSGRSTRRTGCRCIHALLSGGLRQPTLTRPLSASSAS